MVRPALKCREVPPLGRRASSVGEDARTLGAPFFGPDAVDVLAIGPRIVFCKTACQACVIV